MAQGEDTPLAAGVLDRLDAIGTSLDKVTERLEKVAAASRRTRQLAIGLGISFLLDIVLTVIVTLLSLSAFNTGTAVHQSQLTACAIGNQARLAQIELWTYVVDLSAKNPHQDEAQLKAFQAFVDKTFAPVNCAQLYR